MKNSERGEIRTCAKSDIKTSWWLRDRITGLISTYWSCYEIGKLLLSCRHTCFLISSSTDFLKLEHFQGNSTFVTDNNKQLQFTMLICIYLFIFGNCMFRWKHWQRTRKVPPQVTCNVMFQPDVAREPEILQFREFETRVPKESWLSLTRYNMQCTFTWSRTPQMNHFHFLSCFNNSLGYIVKRGF